MRALLTVLAATVLGVPAIAAPVIIDATHGATLRVEDFDAVIDFTAQLIGGSPSTFTVDFTGLTTPDPRFCAGFPDSPDCHGFVPISYEDYFDASTGDPEWKELDLPFFCCGYRGAISFSATSGGTILINAPGTVAPVPEPTSWAMMLGGFGLVGGAMRARRKAAVSFA